MAARMNPQLAALSEAFPAALMVWRLGTRLLQRARGNPQALRWARVGLGAGAIFAVAGVAVALANSTQQRVAGQRLEARLDDEIEDSFPASDPPSLARSGA